MGGFDQMSEIHPMIRKSRSSDYLQACRKQPVRRSPHTAPEPSRSAVPDRATVSHLAAMQMIACLQPCRIWASLHHILPARVGDTRCRSILTATSAREPSGVGATTRSQRFDTGPRARLLAIARMASAATRRRVTPPTLSKRLTTGVRPRELQRRQAVKKRAKKEPKLNEGVKPFLV